MAVYFLNMKTFGRSSGSSATSAIAYRAGERIRDERTGRVFDHSGRDDVMHKEIVLPERFADSDMSWTKNRETLWNAVEGAETRVNSRVAREFLVALPVELTPEQRLELVRGFSQELADRYRFVVDFAIHAPRTDPRNFHAHLLASTRELTSSGFGAKTTLELSDAARHQRGLEPFVKELIATRERWAALTNASLEAAQVTARVDHRTLAAQGIDREPALHLPRAIYEMERRGESNEIADRLRALHQSRVAARVAAAAAGVQPPRPDQERAATAVPAAVQTSLSERRPPPSLEDIRRQARENWLQLREQAGAARERAAPGRSRDEDLSR
jgi:ATP-dependent exoDNAse (exonuclease V) alpha subunit